METDKKQHIYRTIMLIFLSMLITFLITASYYQNNSKQKLYLQIGNNLSNLEQKFHIIDDTIEEYYIGEIKEEDLLEGSIKGYVSGLGDIYTQYMTKAEWEELETNVNGNYVGIGVYMTQNREKEIIIITTIKNSPAEEAKLQTGDIILKVNGEECKGQELTAISNKIKGIEGSEVSLEIKRDNEILNFNIKRKNVKINNIETEVLDNNIGYIQMLSFDNGSSKEFKEKFLELKEKKIKSLIIDIRDNAGGIVEEAINVADLIIEKGNVILITKDKNDKKEIFKAKNNVTIDMEVVLLINENSASASEILAAALKDNNEATLIGTTTYGKGVMQQVFEFNDGSAIKVTTNEFYSPNEITINELGVEPEITVELNEEDDEDTQLKRAIEYLQKKQ